MDIHQLKHFLALANTLNYRRTAESVFIAQPALSRQIQQLEGEVGALLFKRDKRNVALTPAGAYLRQETGRLIEQLEGAFRRTAQIHRGEAGEIRIGHASSAMQSILPKLLVSLREKTPDLRALLMETTNRFQMEALQNREIDVGFSPNIIAPPNISSRVVYTENFVVILPENHSVSPETFTDLSVFAHDAFILPPLSEGIGYVESIQALCQQWGFLPRIAHESAYSGTVLRLVEAGMGISIEPASTLQGQHLRLKTIELTHIPQKAEMRMLWLTERTDELKTFLRWLIVFCDVCATASPDHYTDGILAGDRLTLSRAITLVESRRPDDQALAQRVLEGALPQTGNSVRVGITGVPGVGKSTFIEALGSYLTSLGHRLAVLAVDPTSQRSGGSLLGDKTRMETLSMNPSAYIRPSPAGDSLGGVGHRTRETMLLCEAAGFDVILVETVGVGQSETVVHGMVDFFLLLMLAGAGDELQGMKRGIMELADALLITKADGDNIGPANRARVDYQNALHLLPPTGTGWFPPVLTGSALSGAAPAGETSTGVGVAELWQIIQEHQTLTTRNGYRAGRRQEQQLTWFRSLLRQQLEGHFYNQTGVRERLAAIEAQVRAGTLLPGPAVESLLGQPATE